MSNTSPYEFHHEIRQSSIILIMHVLFIEMTVIFFHFIIGEFLVALDLHDMSALGMSIMTWEIAIFHLINIIAVLMAIRAWTNTSYTLTPWIITVTSGILYKKRTSFEIRHIESASIKQGILGRIFDYGTVQIKSHYFDADISLKRIPAPYHLVQTIEDQRLYDESLVIKK